MVLRNRCLYADLGRDVEHVGREHAYLMIVVALEVLARQVSPYFRYPGIAEHETGDDEMERRVRADLAAFMDQERGLVDLDRIDFLADPERYDAINKAAGQRLFGGRTADRRRRHRRRSR